MLPKSCVVSGSVAGQESPSSRRREDRRGAFVGTDETPLLWSPRLGGHLEAARRAAGMRRTGLAAQLGVSEETIRLWENGSVQPSEARLVRLIALVSLGAADWPATADPVPELPAIARRLVAERKERGTTQAAVVKAMDVPHATYAGWETGRSAPGIQWFAKIGTFLGISEVAVATLCAVPFVVDFAKWPAFGQFVGARRQELRLNRAEMAEALGVSVRSVVSWELGYRVPGPKQLTRLAAVLSVEMASLVAALPRRVVTTTLGDLILSRQRELGLCSADLADLVGTTEATVSRWVHGRSRPVPRNLVRLADALQMPYVNVVEAAAQAA